MKRTISLSGTWTLTGENEAGAPLSLPIRIPGYVTPTLEAAGLIPPMYYRDNAKGLRWIEEKTWRFSYRFDLPKGSVLGARLRFESVDTFARYELNGVTLGESDNMFCPSEFSVASVLREAGNELVVTVLPWRECLGDVPPLEAAFSTWERVYIRRTQCTFFWDWVERFVSAGIAGSVDLILPDYAEIEDVSVVTRSLIEDYASLLLEVETKGARDGAARYEITLLDPDGNTVWQECARVCFDRVSRQAEIHYPRLWWPEGYGDQPLYTACVRLLDADGNLLDEKCVTFGIRTVQLFYPRDEVGSFEEERTRYKREIEGHYNPAVPEQTHTGEGMILVVNGVRINAKGANWVPPTPFPGADDEAIIRHLVKMAAEGHQNFLRVWGGGVYGSEAFYDACDRYGVMVSQDFMFSCGTYPYTDEKFLASVEREARYQVRRLRNRPSLVFWTGNNENCDYFDFDDPKEPTRPMAERVLLPVMRELAPTHDFRLGSPWGGYDNGEGTVGDNHGSFWWVGAETITPRFFDAIARFNSESPFAGYTLPSSLRRFLSEEDIATEDSEVFEYHIKNNPFFTEVLKWPSVHGRLIRNSEILVGKPKCESERLYNRAYIQYEWARFAIEGARRAKWFNAALQFWMYNDCWPAVGYASIDFYGKPKAGWYSAKRAFAPLAASVTERDGTLLFYTLNDSRTTHKLTYRVRVLDAKSGASRTLKEGETTSLANENGVVLTLPCAELSGEIVLFELFENGTLVDRARWYARWLADLTLGRAKVAVVHNERENTVTLTCTEGFAVGVALDGEAIFDQGFVDLCEGESVTVSYTALEGFAGVTPYGYNVDFVEE